MNSETQIFELALEVLSDHQAEAVHGFKSDRLLGYTDYVILATGRSKRHQLTLADKLTQEIKRIFQLLVVQEGDDSASWLILDCNYVVIHLQTQEARDYYNLEGLWFPPE
ncbi:MAG: ribosome silencing factor [Gammaproteobacteria bacterium]